jgi:hypothetical protein
MVLIQALKKRSSHPLRKELQMACQFQVDIAQSRVVVVSALEVERSVWYVTFGKAGDQRRKLPVVAKVHRGVD